MDSRTWAPMHYLYRIENLEPRPLYGCKRPILKKIREEFSKTFFSKWSPDIYFIASETEVITNRISDFLPLKHLNWKYLFRVHDHNQLNLRNERITASVWGTPEFKFWLNESFVIVLSPVKKFRFSLLSLFWAVRLYFSNFFRNQNVIDSDINYFKNHELLNRNHTKLYLTNPVWSCSWPPSCSRWRSLSVREQCLRKIQRTFSRRLCN